MQAKEGTNTNQNIEELKKVVLRLRNPVTGCPWDKKQTNKSLVPHTIEEAHEVADAINRENNEDLCDELGDLLLQIVMHAQIANEANYFSFEDVAKAATNKMIRRHPNVFSKKTINSNQDINKTWDEIKEEESKFSDINNTFSEKLRRKVRSKSSLEGAIYISSQAFKKGLNWDSLGEGYQKLNQGYDLIKQYKDKRLDYIKKAIKEIIISIINICGIYKFSLEEALNENNIEYINRISYIERKLNEIAIRDLPADELKSLWEESKCNYKENQK